MLGYLSIAQVSVDIFAPNEGYYFCTSFTLEFNTQTSNLSSQLVPTERF